MARESVTTYKGYEADVYVENGKTHIHVTNSSDSLSTICETEGPLATPDAALADLIEDYFETCCAVCKSPAKPS